MLSFSCPGCSRKLQVKEALAGKRAKCPRCGQVVTVPAEPSPAGSVARRQTFSATDNRQEESDLTGASTPFAVNEETLAAQPASSQTKYDFLAPPQQPDELGRLGPYRVLKVLGAGGMGVVFQAEDPHLRRLVALKVVNPSQAGDTARQRFLREARTTAALDHDNVVAIYQVGEDRGVPFLAMQMLQGESLDERAKREGRLPVPEVLRIGREMAEGLAAAHEKGLIHRDIKPGNVWLEGKRGRVKLLDFGLARGGGDEPNLTQSGSILGTPAYMAPEQARGEDVDPRCDLFSLGAVLYRLCTGEVPFKGKDTMSVLMALGMHHPKPPDAIHADVPAALSSLVMRLLNKEREGRPASAQVVAEELAAIAAEDGKTDRLPKAQKKGSGLNPVKSDLGPRLKAMLGLRRTTLLAALLLLALVPLGWWLATVILRVESADGTLVVEINDAETEARIQNGKLILTGPDARVRYTLSPSERNRKIDAGPYSIRVEGADGLVLDTPEFTLKKGGTVTVRVTAEPRAAAKNFDPDREAALWVLSIGGMVWVNGERREIRAAAQLPPEAFRLTSVYLHENKQVTDAGLAHFKDCKNLTELSLTDTKVSDAGLGNFKDCKNLKLLGLAYTQVGDTGLASMENCKNLTVLDLGATRVTDSGLAHFKDCRNLTALHLYQTQVSDAGLAHFKECKNLNWLNLTATQVSDAGLAHFKGCKGLTALNLVDTRVSDTGLAHFKDCKNLKLLGLSFTQVSDTGLAIMENYKNLTEVGLGGTRVTDTGLAHFKNCKNLTVLLLFNMELSDAGLAHFKGCKNLRQLVLYKTKVTATEIEKVKQALPGCKIEWDGGVIEPRASLDPDREAALWVLSIGGLVRVNGQELEVQAAADLPRESFQLTSVNLRGNKQVTDAGLGHFKDCKNLTDLYLNGTRVSDGGLASFRHCTNLTGLDLHDTPVTDIGLAYFKDCKNLNQLYLARTMVTDAGLGHFKDCKNLVGLDLSVTGVSDAGLAHFKDCKKLTLLNLSDTQLSDKGLAHFNDCKNLGWLSLSGTRVSDLGLTYFKNCKKLGVFALAGTQVSDKGLASLNDCKNLMAFDLGGTRVSDEGLAHFKDCKKLKDVYLWNTQVGDRGLAYLKHCENLNWVNLAGTQVSDAGLANFKDCKYLTCLILSNTRVGDAGLAHLKDCGKLTQLLLRNTKVTAAKIEELKKALPACKIEWDGGFIEPRANLDPDRTAAEWVLSIGGSVYVNGGEREIKAAADLPKAAFRLTVAWLEGNERADDAGMAHFQDCKSLTVLSLNGTRIGDAGLGHFSHCENLTFLALGGTLVSDVGLTHFKGCKKVWHLYLHSTQVTDVGLANFKDCKELVQLGLQDTKVSDAGLEAIQDCKKLRVLSLQKTKVTAAKIQELKKALPKCKIEWDGGTIEPKAKLDATRRNAEGVRARGRRSIVYDCS